MKFASRYLVAAALVAAPVSLAAQTTPPPAAQGEHARARDAAHRLAAESAKADFVKFQRRIHSLTGRTWRIPV